jgi:hypothetical protein
MRDSEQECLETLLGAFPARIARVMRGVYDQEQLLGDDQELTPVGRAWVEGYVSAQLVVIRSVTTGKPNLSDDDAEMVNDLVLQHESEIAAQLYA